MALPESIDSRESANASVKLPAFPPTIMPAAAFASTISRDGPCSPFSTEIIRLALSEEEATCKEDVGDGFSSTLLGSKRYE